MGLKQKQEYVDWLREYNWAWFCTLTFRDGVWRKAAVRLFGKWIAQIQAVEPDLISWVRMGEYSRKNHRYHLHVLIAGVQNVTLRQATARWERLAGRAEIGLYDSNRRGLEYLLKSLEETSTPGRRCRAARTTSTHQFSRWIDADFARSLGDSEGPGQPSSKRCNAATWNSCCVRQVNACRTQQQCWARRDE